MAKYVVTGNNVEIGGTDVSASVARAELTITSTEVDVTDFASGGFTEVIGGLKSGSLSLDFHTDFGAGALNTVLTEDLVGTLVEIVVIAGNGSVASAATPSYTAKLPHKFSVACERRCGRFVNIQRNIPDEWNCH